MPAPWYRWDGDTLLLDVHVQPGASRDQLAGVHGDRLKIRIAAPPLEGRANRHLVAFLARLCGVPRARVTLVAGEGGRRKRIRVESPRTLPEGVQAPDR